MSRLEHPSIVDLLQQLYMFDEAERIEAETKGSGIRVMRNLMEQAGLELPQFESDRQNDEFRATYLFHHFLSDQDVEWLGKFKHLNLNTEQCKALVYARETGNVSNSAYRDLNKVNIVEASHDLCQLRDLGVLESKGAGRATYYVLSQDLASRPEMGSLLEFIDENSPGEACAHDGPGEKPAKSGSKPDNLDDKPDNLDAKPANLGTKPANLDEKPLVFGEEGGGPEDMRRQCEKALGFQADKSLRGDSVKRVIRLLCATRPCTALQLAKVLERNPRYLKQAYILPMLKAGELEYLYPETPNHPKQAYRGKSVGEGEE